MAISPSLQLVYESGAYGARPERLPLSIGDPTLAEMAYNKYPHYLVGPWNLSQRFLMHGFFTEHLHARLERVRLAGR